MTWDRSDDKMLLNCIPAVDSGEGGGDGGGGVDADRVGTLVGGGCAVAGDGLAPLGVRGRDGEDAAVLGAGEVEGAVLQHVVHQLLEEGVPEVLEGENSIDI